MQTLLSWSVESLISVKLTADLVQFEHRSRQHTVYATLTTIECSTLKSGAVPVSVVNTSCAVRNLKFRREFRPRFFIPVFRAYSASNEQRRFIKFPTFSPLTTFQSRSFHKRKFPPFFSLSINGYIVEMCTYLWISVKE